MKNSYIIGGVVALVVIAAIAAYAFNQQGSTTTVDQQNGMATTTATTTKTTTPVPGAKKTTTTTTTVTTSGNDTGPVKDVQTPLDEVQSFEVNANDQTADLKRIVVPVGTNVSINFNVDAKGTYHGGLDFRSASLNTGTIVPGASQRVSFVATKSFSFIPYWPNTNEAKPYTIDVVVTNP